MPLIRLDRQGRPTTRMTTNSFIYVAAFADELNSLFETKPTYIITNVTELLYFTYMYAFVTLVSFARDHRSGDCKALLILLCVIGAIITTGRFMDTLPFASRVILVVIVAATSMTFVPPLSLHNDRSPANHDDRQDNCQLPNEYGHGNSGYLFLPLPASLVSPFR